MVEHYCMLKYIHQGKKNQSKQTELEGIERNRNELKGVTSVITEENETVQG